MNEDENVVLRKFEEKDIASIYLFRNDPQIKRNLGGFSLGYSTEDIKKWIEFHNKSANEMMRAIVTKTDDICIGHVGFYNIDFRTRKAEFAIIVGDQNCQGKGIGKKVTKEMLRIGFKELNLHKIYLTVLESNIKAINLYKSFGFHNDGILIDEVFRDGSYHNMFLMSLLESEYAR